jgi:excisionase family DNA binding protein
MSEIEDLLDRVGFLSVAKATRYLGIGKTKLYAEMNSGRLEAMRRGSRTLIRRQALDEWILKYKPADADIAEMMRAMQQMRRGRS